MEKKILKRKIGKLPMLVGEYQEGRVYAEKERCVLMGSEYQSKCDGNDTAPAVLNPLGTAITVNTEKWMVISEGSSYWLEKGKIASMDAKIKKTKDENAMLAFGRRTKVATVNDVEIHVTMPANPDTHPVDSVAGKTGAITVQQIADALTGAGFKLTDSHPVDSVAGATGIVTVQQIADALTAAGYKLTDTDTNTHLISSVVGKTGAITVQQIADALTAAGYKLTDTDTNTTYQFVDKNATLEWGAKSTIATVGGVDLHVTLPGNYAVPSVVGKTGAITVQQIADALTGAGFKLTDNHPVDSVAGKTGAVTAKQIADALTAAGYNLTGTGAQAVASVAGRTGVVTVQQIADALTAAGYKLTDTDTNTTYQFVDKNATLEWGAKSTIATVGGVDLHVTLPGNYAVPSVVGKTGAISAEQIADGLIAAGYTLTKGSGGVPTLPQGGGVMEQPVGNLLYKVGLISDAHFDGRETSASPGTYSSDDISNALDYFRQEGVAFIASAGDFVEYENADYGDEPYDTAKKYAPTKGFTKLYHDHAYKHGIRLFGCTGNHDFHQLYDQGAGHTPQENMWIYMDALHSDPANHEDKDMYFFEYDGVWNDKDHFAGNSALRAQNRTMKSKMSYWFEKNNDIYVILSIDYGADPLPSEWGTLIRGINLVDYSDAYVQQMTSYVGGTGYDRTKDGNFDYQFYHPNALIWLKNIIENNTDKRIFVFNHYPLPNKAGNGTPNNGKWYNSRVRMFPYPATEDLKKRYYSGSNTLCGIEYYFLSKLNNAYKNVMWFSGHSHLRWEEHQYDPYVNFCNRDFDIVKPTGTETTPLTDSVDSLIGGQYDYKRYTRLTETPKEGTVGWTVHLPSLSKPTDMTSGTRTPGASQGAVLEVYDQCVAVRQVIFKAGGETGYKNLIYGRKVIKNSEMGV